MQETGKADRVQSMFDQLAPRYDMMNRVMTLGQDQRWRRHVVSRLTAPENGVLLDLAAGTGDIAFEMRRRFPAARVIAGDFSLGMLQRGNKREGGDQVEWVACDALNLPFADRSFDGVAFGYLLRNVTDLDKAIKEIFRVLKPGAPAICLDTTPPPPGLLRPFLSFYLKRCLPLLGRLLAGDAPAYNYLSESTLSFADPESLKQAFMRHGFEQIDYRLFMFRTIAVHRALKPASP